MADATKHLHINGGTLISELKRLFSLVRTRKTRTFVYGFMFAFVIFTAFLAFNPFASSSSPWFSSIFNISGSSSSSSSGNSDRSQFSNFYSYFFPNSSQSEQVHNFSPFPTQTNITRSSNTTIHPPELNKQPFNAKNETNSGVLKPNQTTIHTPQTPVQNQTNGQVLKTNQTAIPAPVPPVVKNQTNGQVLKTNQTTIPAPVPPVVKNQTNGQVLKTNQTTFRVPESPAAKNQTNGQVLKTNGTTIRAPEIPANQSSTLPTNSTLEKKKKSGKEKKDGLEKGVAENPKKQSNGTSSEMSAKQRMENWMKSLANCDLFDGNWVRDDSYPLYKPGSCSLIDEQFNCFLNGRPDKDYLKLKWKPKGCILPRLDGSNMLKMLRGKRLVFVGDSLNRNMWESLVCILRNSVKDQSKVYEASGKHHFRGEASYSFIFKDYGCSVEFFVSPFLVQEWEVPEKDGSKKETLRLDLIGRSSDKYKNADILIFNTGHWWTHEKTSLGKDYYQEGSHVYGQLKVIEAFRKALTTWARWVDANVNAMKTQVFFRGYSASHFSGGRWNSGGQCDSETEPIKNDTYLSGYPPKMTVLESVLHGMKTPATYLNITRLTDYRKDAHPSVYRKQHFTAEEKKAPLLFQDCSHWCLPGVPDAWNELLYAELLINQYKKQQQQKRP